MRPQPRTSGLRQCGPTAPAQVRSFKRWRLSRVVIQRARARGFRRDAPPSRREAAGIKLIIQGEIGEFSALSCADLVPAVPKRRTVLCLREATPEGSWHRPLCPRPRLSRHSNSAASSPEHTWGAPIDGDCVPPPARRPAPSRNADSDQTARLRTAPALSCGTRRSSTPPRVTNLRIAARQLS